MMMVRVQRCGWQAASAGIQSSAVFLVLNVWYRQRERENYAEKGGNPWYTALFGIHVVVHVVGAARSKGCAVIYLMFINWALGFRVISLLNWGALLLC